MKQNLSINKINTITDLFEGNTDKTNGLYQKPKLKVKNEIFVFHVSFFMAYVAGEVQEFGKKHLHLCSEENQFVLPSCASLHQLRQMLQFPNGVITKSSSNASAEGHYNRT